VTFAVEWMLDGRRMIAVPSGELPGGTDDRDWAQQEAEALAQFHGLGGERTAAIAATLVGVRQLAGRLDGSHFLIYDINTELVAPLRIALLDIEPTGPQRQAFLSPPAPLAPQLRQAVNTPLGEGVSSVLLTNRPGVAEVRWMYVAAGVTLLATLAPVARQAVMGAAAAVEDLLAELRLEGAAVAASASFDPAQIVAESLADQPAWRS